MSNFSRLCSVVMYEMQFLSVVSVGISTREVSVNCRDFSDSADFSLEDPLIQI